MSQTRKLRRRHRPRWEEDKILTEAERLSIIVKRKPELRRCARALKGRGERLDDWVLIIGDLCSATVRKFMKHTLGVDPLPGRKTESQFVIWPRPKRVTIDDLKNDANADLAAVLEGPREPGCVYWLAIFVGVMEAGVIDIQDGSAIRASSGASTLFVRNADDAWKVERG